MNATGIDSIEINLLNRREAIANAPQDPAASALVADFLAHLDFLLSQNHDMVTTLVFNEANRWLDGNLYADIVWPWILKQAHSADDLKKTLLRISVFEMIPEDPICEGNVWRLFDLLPDPQNHWIILAAYESHPDKFFPHFDAYVNRINRVQAAIVD